MARGEHAAERSSLMACSTWQVINRYPRVLERLEASGYGQMPDAHGGAGPVDNLYLDMNGIIHPCFHPEDGEPPRSEEEV